MRVGLSRSFAKYNIVLRIAPPVTAKTNCFCENTALSTGNKTMEFPHFQETLGVNVVKPRDIAWFLAQNSSIQEIGIHNISKTTYIALSSLLTFLPLSPTKERSALFHKSSSSVPIVWFSEA
jgi:hypothetical protein